MANLKTPYTKIIALVWEQTNPTVFSPQLALARALIKRGHRIALVVTDPQGAERLIQNVLPHAMQHIRLLHAPLWRAKHRASTPVCVPELLLTHGYHAAQTLEKLAEAWTELFQDIQPDLIFSERAPTALLAARGFAATTIALGTGFGDLRDGEPIADLCPYAIKPEDRIPVSAKWVLGSVNTVREKWQLPPLETLAQLYRADRHISFSIPELDTHPGPCQYLGPCIDESHVPSIHWPPASNKQSRVLVYFSQSPKHLRDMADVLRAIEACTLSFAEADAASALQRTLSAPHHPAELGIPAETLLRDCTLLISDCAPLLTLALARGVACLIEPRTLELATLARLAEDTGLARTLRPSDDAPSILGKIHFLIARKTTQPLAARHKHLSWSHSLACLLKLCDPIE